MSQATNDATFTNDVLSSHQPVLVDFWAPWRGPCRMVGPIIAHIGEKTAGKAQVFKLNVDENPDNASRYGISGIPTIIVYQNGQVRQQFVGIKPEQVYLKALEN